MTMEIILFVQTLSVLASWKLTRENMAGHSTKRKVWFRLLVMITPAPINMMMASLQRPRKKDHPE